MLITGMLMSGKMSVGVRNSTSGVSSTITSANTINVYGLFRAKRTTHILVFEFLQPGRNVGPRPACTGATVLSIRPHRLGFGYARAHRQLGLVRYIFSLLLARQTARNIALLRYFSV